MSGWTGMSSRTPGEARLGWDDAGRHGRLARRVHGRGDGRVDHAAGLGARAAAGGTQLVPCRIVLADLSRERVLPPPISIAQRVATLAQTKLRGSRVMGRKPLAGVAVEVRDS